jgi:hypothetical protein
LRSSRSEEVRRPVTKRILIQRLRTKGSGFDFCTQLLRKSEYHLTRKNTSANRQSNQTAVVACPHSCFEFLYRVIAIALNQFGNGLAGKFNCIVMPSVCRTVRTLPI